MGDNLTMTTPLGLTLALKLFLNIPRFLCSKRSHAFAIIVERPTCKKRTNIVLGNFPFNSEVTIIFWFSKTSLFTRSILPVFSREVWNSTRNIPYWWHTCSTPRGVSLIGCYLHAKIQNQATTNQSHYTDLCRATSSVWNFWGWILAAVPRGSQPQ